MQLLEDPMKSLARLLKFRAAGGSVSFVHADWHDDALISGPFNFIYCRNGLRLSPKPYWRHSLERFFSLLAPGGVLILETLNAIALEEEVTDMLHETGFITLTPEGIRSSEQEYVDAHWPTG